MRFILIDEILELDPGRRIVGVKRVAPDEDYFRDHFPGFPVVPGVLLTEMLAQTAGKCLDAEDPARGKSMLAKIQGASFRAWVRPGDVAVLKAEVGVSRATYATATGRVEVGNQLVASADLLFSFVAGNQFAAGYRDEVLEAYYARHGRPPAKPPTAGETLS